MKQLPIRTQIALENNREGNDGLTQADFDGLVDAVPVPLTVLQIARNFPTVTAVPAFIEYASADVDDVGAWDIANPSIITVPDGYTHCRILASVSWAAATTGTREIQLIVNTNVPVFPYYKLQDIAISNGAADSVMTQFTGLLMGVTAGDEMEIQALQNSGAGITLADGNSVIVVEWYNKRV